MTRVNVLYILLFFYISGAYSAMQNKIELIIMLGSIQWIVEIEYLIYAYHTSKLFERRINYHKSVIFWLEICDVDLSMYLWFGRINMLI